MPLSTACMQLSTVCMPLSTACMLCSTACMPLYTACMLCSTACMPLSTACMKCSTACMPLYTACMQLSTVCMPLSTACMPPSCVCVQCAVRFPDIASSIVHVLMNYLGDEHQKSALDVIHFVRDIVHGYPDIRESVVHKLIVCHRCCRNAFCFCFVSVFKDDHFERFVFGFCDWF